jgi:hypothetical protein
VPPVAHADSASAPAAASAISGSRIRFMSSSFAVADRS